MNAPTDRRWSAAAGTAPATPGRTTPMRPGEHRGRGFDEGFGRTDRTDNWWALPLVQAIALAVLLGYATWAALQGNHYLVTEGGRDYLSPFYSPLLLYDWWPLSPALLILAIPIGFRTTCYYYRKAYYRVFFGDPAACAVGELRSKGYRGETAFPFILQNLHRYFLYFALLFIILLGKDAFESFFYKGRFGIGVGSIILTINVILIACYTFGCHSFRHLVGGRKDCMSSCGKSTVALGSWKQASWFNARHMQFAWASLVWVMVSDLYVRLVAMGTIRDLHTW